MPDPDTICGYKLSDVRKSLREAIDFRNRRAAHRWAAELVATPGAVGSLWSSYWLAWAVAQGSPSIPILLRQSWLAVSDAAHQLQDWKAFRNAPDVRRCVAEMTTRLLDQPRQTTVVWPTRDMILYDVGTMRSSPPPAAADGPAVMEVWNRMEDSLEVRIMAGRFLSAIEVGDLRMALSAVAWTFLPAAIQGTPVKYAGRGPASLLTKARASPLWFWLEVGGRYVKGRNGHRGWPTLHAAVLEAFQNHYKRWTASERMRILLAWILQIRAALVPQPTDIWAAHPITFQESELDLPYKEIAAELTNPNAIKSPQKEKKHISKMEQGDAAIMAVLGITEED